MRGDGHDAAEDLPPPPPPPRRELERIDVSDDDVPNAEVALGTAASKAPPPPPAPSPEQLPPWRRPDLLQPPPCSEPSTGSRGERGGVEGVGEVGGEAAADVPSLDPVMPLGWKSVD